MKKFYLYLKRKVKNFSYRKAVVFMVCLALSSFLWLLSSLEKRYTSRITVPVNYVDFPKDKQLSGMLPQQFDLIVDAYGYTLLTYKLRLAFSPIMLNVSEWIDNAVERGKKLHYTIFTINHKEEIEKLISSETRILTFKPDSLVFNFSEIVTRKIPVQLNLKLYFENQYSQKEKITSIPDSVMVSGPKTIMDTLHSVATNYKIFTRLSRSVEQILVLQPIAGLKIVEKEVRVLISVEQNTEVTFDIPIHIINLPPDITLKTFPGRVKVTCRIGLSKYKDLDDSYFRAFIDYKKLFLKEQRLPVSFENHSTVVLSANYAPMEVEYILENRK